MNLLKKTFNFFRDAWNSVPQLWRYALIGAASFVLSIGGVILAAYRHHWEDGGRGGAIATIVAIFIVLLRPDYGQKIFEQRNANIGPDLPQLEQLQQEVRAIVAAMRINSQGQTRLNRGLVIASTIGTLFWGLGDLLAKWMMGFF